MKKKLILLMEIIIIILIITIIPQYIYSIYKAIFNVNTGASISHFGAVFIVTIKIALIIIVLLLLKKQLKKYQLKAGLPICSINIKTKILKYKKTTILLSSITIIALFFVSIYSFQRSVIYFPNYYHIHNEQIKKTNLYNEINIVEEEGLILNGWSRFDENRLKTIIYFGGNTESAAPVFNYHHNNNWKLFNEFNFIMVDYPGYGKSEGYQTEKTLFEMAISTYNYVNKELGVSSDNIYVIGYSLGSGVATYISSVKSVDKLLLIAPYSSMIDVFNTNLPFFYGPFKNIIKDKYSSTLYGRDVEAKTLIIASKKDKVIKHRLSLKLQKAINNANLMSFDALSHNQFISDVDVNVVIKEFLISK